MHAGQPTALSPCCLLGPVTRDENVLKEKSETSEQKTGTEPFLNRVLPGSRVRVPACLFRGQAVPWASVSLTPCAGLR